MSTDTLAVHFVPQNHGTGIDNLLAAAKRLCMLCTGNALIYLGLILPPHACKLFENIVLPILICSCGVWIVTPEAELMDRQLYLSVKMRSVATRQIMLAEFGHCLLNPLPAEPLPAEPTSR